MSLKQFKVVNVFADHAFMGNPVAVVTDADDLETQQMQSFAAWNGMPETVYLFANRDPSNAQYHARIFSPLAELAFAGHPSLGAAHVAMESGVTNATSNTAGSKGFEKGCSATLWQHCQVGKVEMKLHIDDGGVRRIYVKTPADGVAIAFSDTDARSILGSVGCNVSSVGSAVYRVSAGAHWIVLPLTHLLALESLMPDMPAIKALSELHQVSGITAYAPLANGSARFEVRSFGPLIGVPEDAVCGGGNACVAAMNAFLDEARGEKWFSSYSTVQGRFVGRSGSVNIMGPVESGRFWIGGATRTIMTGQVNF
jgi:PhzF family phenazine biosynthesis protein